MNYKSCFSTFYMNWNYIYSIILKSDSFIFLSANIDATILTVLRERLYQISDEDTKTYHYQLGKIKLMTFTSFKQNSCSNM